MQENTESSRHITLSSKVIACFFLSGSAGLIYQVLWLRMIDKVIGSAPFAVATVLSVFMGGLALGSYLAGKFIDRIPARHRLLTLYGMAEIAIGIYGLLLPFLIIAVKPIYALSYNLLFEHFWPYLLFTFLGCSVLLIIPTTLMGITLPVLCRFYVASLGHMGTRTGRLYGINTIGAAVGTIICGFILIARFGVWGSLFTAAGINFLVGTVCLILGRRYRSLDPEDVVKAKEDDHREEAPSPDASSFEHETTVLWALWIFGISGFCSMAYEVFWTRLLGLIIGPTTYSFTIVVATFIVGLALGSLIFGWLADRVREVFRLLALTQLCAASLAILVSQFLGNSQFFFSKLIYTFQESFGETAFFKAIILFFVLVGPTIFLGATFPLVNKIYARSMPSLGKSIGTAYAINTIGAILGSFTAGFIIIPLLGKEDGLRLVTGLQIVSALLALGWLIFRSGEMKWERIRSWATVVIGLILGMGLLLNFPSWNRSNLSRGWYHRYSQLGSIFKTTSWLEAIWKGSKKIEEYESDRTKLVFYGDGIGGFTTVQKAVDPIGTVIYSLLNSGKGDASTLPKDISTMTMAAHFPLLFHPDPKKVMVIGLASGMTAGEALLYPGVKQMDVVDINDQVIKACKFFNPWNNNCLTDPRSHIIVQDGRNHLELTREKYDVIISEPSNPWMAGLANLFTLDFFETVRERMKDNGTFVQWIHSYQTDWSSFSMVGRTFTEVFSESIFVKASSEDFLLIGFKGKRNIDIDVAYQNLPFAQKSQNIIIRDPKPLYTMIVTEDLKGFFGPGPLHTDNWPRLEFAAPKKLTKLDLTIASLVRKGGWLSDRTREIIESCKNNMDSTLDMLELSIGYLPSFDIPHIQKASPGQLKRYQDILSDYCSNVFMDDYGKISNQALKVECAKIQAGKIRNNISSAGENPNDYYFLAKVYSILDSPKEELDALKKAISLGTNIYGAYKNMGIALAKEGRFEEAASHLFEALKLKPGDTDTHYNLGRIFAAQGRFNDAIPHYYKVLEIDPKNANLHFDLGLAHANQNQMGKAADHFKEALRINPNYFAAIYGLGVTLAREGQFKEAADHLFKAIEIQPDNPMVLNELGLILGQLNRFDEALQCFSKAIKLSPDDPRLHDNMGVALVKIGRPREAIKHFSKALEINSSYSIARDHLNAIQSQM